MYYLRTKAAADAIQFTVESEAESTPVKDETMANLAERSENIDPLSVEAIACSLDNADDCMMCGS